jgi:hypothetical protein
MREMANGPGTAETRCDPGHSCGESRLSTHAGQTFFFAHWIAKSLTFRQPALLWITEWRIWGPGNSHLYYKLRQSYGDQRLLEEAPGHLFLEHESEDLASFLQLSMLNGWGGYLLTQATM